MSKEYTAIPLSEFVEQLKSAIVRGDHIEISNRIHGYLFDNEYAYLKDGGKWITPVTNERGYLL